MINEKVVLITSLVVAALIIIFKFLLPAILQIIAAFYWLFKPEEKEPEPEEVQTYHERKVYPYNFDDFIGQPKVKESLLISVSVSKKLERAFPHTLLYGLPGLGKTTLAELIAQEMRVPFISIEGITLESKDAIIKVVNQITENTIVFIDEIHQVSSRMSEVWYKVMENNTIDILDQNSIYTLDIPKFTTIGATTDFGKMLKPFRDRFIYRFELLPYTIEELQQIIARLAEMPKEVINMTARISQKTPRLAKHYVFTMQEYAVANDRTVITVEDFKRLTYLNDINKYGLTGAQMRALHALSRAGTKVGKDALATAAHVSSVDLEEVIEPFLVIEGYVARTPRGREITGKGQLLIKEMS